MTTTLNCIITYKQLEELEACEEQLELFKKTFGKSVKVTKENCLKACELDFCIDWVVDNLLDEVQEAEYWQIEKSAWEEYKRITVSSWEKYAQIAFSALEEHKRRSGLALEEHERTKVPAQEKYKKQCWLGFYEAATKGVK